MKWTINVECPNCGDPDCCGKLWAHEDKATNITFMCRKNIKAAEQDEVVGQITVCWPLPHFVDHPACPESFKISREQKEKWTRSGIKNIFTRYPYLNPMVRLSEKYSIEKEYVPGVTPFDKMDDVIDQKNVVVQVENFQKILDK